MKYEHKQIDRKWQQYWEEQSIFDAMRTTGREKKYVLDMFSYPSGDGLHTGHPRSYTATDIFSRYYRMKGYDVLHPVGWDAFGLPAENYAIKVGTHPAETTAKNIERFRSQLKSLGFSYNWKGEINTSDPSYYKWTQWLFKTLFDAGLAYQKEGYVNWCPKDKTVLANEQVTDGCCQRCGTVIEQKKMNQWFFSITDFAEELLTGLDSIDWPNSTKESQRNWIGKSVGAEIEFKLRIAGVEDGKYSTTVFTTRPDTLGGVTFLVISPETAQSWMENGWKPSQEVVEYTKKSMARLERDRLEAVGDKTGVDAGVLAIHPLSGEAIPVWVADYVLGGYGTGSIMAVPGHDERDFDFATKFGLPIKEVVQPLIKVVEGEDAVREGEDFEERNAVVCIIKHWSEDKYLCQQWKKVDWRGFVIGGIEPDEDIAEAGIREIREETGYQNPKMIGRLGGVVNSQFYHNVKKVNRWAHFTGLLFQLENSEHSEVADSENELHEMKWVDAREVAEFITASDMKLFWSRVGGKDIYTGKGVLVNSGEFDGMESDQAGDQIVEKVGGEWKTKYKLRDWSVARQRYWGAPIPVIYEKDGDVRSVDVEDLPVLLPMDVDFTPTGEPPLAKSVDFQKGVEEKYGEGARRSVETLDTFVCSSWYYLRYCDPSNNDRFAGAESLSSWMPVDLYIGGAEHTNGHLLYARFITKALHRLGLIDFDEPFLKLRHQGLIMASDGEKMSKSRGNVVNPDDLIEQYGADTVRAYEMFMGPFDQNVAWDTNGVVGVKRFLDKLARMAAEALQNKGEIDQGDLHRLVKKVTEDIESMKFNTVVSSFMEYLNGLGNGAGPAWVDTVVRLIAPMAPHLAEEMWSGLLGNKQSVSLASWPEWNPDLVGKSIVTIAVQEKGKLRGTVEVPAGSSEDMVVQAIVKDEKLVKLVGESGKRIFVADRVINFI